MAGHFLYVLVNGSLLALLLLGLNVGAQPEIHRCLQEDGTIAFQETPCPEPESADDATNSVSANDNDANGTAPADDFFDFVNPFDEPGDPSLPTEPVLPEKLSQDRALCEKTTRDAIDAIDLEMRKGYSKEQGEQYLAELLTLTQQLRACKTL